MVRRLLKRRVEVLFSSPTICSLTKHRVRNKRLILAYHGIIPDGALADGERSLFIAQRDFANQLDMLAEVADVAPLDRLDEEGDGRPRVQITVDHAYRGAVCNGVRELVKRRLPATIFVAPACLDGHVFWWDALASSSGHVDRAIREYALRELDGCDERVRSWARSQSLGKTRPISAHACAATRAELRAAVAFPGITVGSHSWSHANLATLRTDELDSEVARLRVAMMLESDEPGGAEMMVFRLSDELRRRGHTVVPVGPEHGVGWLGDVFRRGGFSPEVFRLRRPIDPGCVRGLVDLFRAHRIDVVHSHEFTMAVYGAAAARLLGLPHIVTMHGGLGHVCKALRRRIALRWALRTSDHAVMVSRATQ